MEAHFIEWLNLSIRWVHVIVGIAWIGASFYFVWLENNLQRTVNNPALAGELWAIHGGGIYHLQKYKIAPSTMPRHLHWFKWEAYSTWLSGVLLLMVVFYLNADSYLVKSGSSFTPMATVAVGVLSLVAGWVVYDALCKSALRKQPVLLGVALFVMLTMAAFILSQIMVGRAAYIHVGAIIGTMMVGNVFFAIMPAQRSLVAAIAAGTEPDPIPPKNALLRSRHNNYLTLPVLFIMISNHFPSTYGSGWNWLILVAIALISIAVRHYFNTRHQTQAFAWALPVGALALMVLAYVTLPQRHNAPVFSHNYEGNSQTATNQSATNQWQAQAIIAKHCVSCHAANPTSTMFATAPAGIYLETLAQTKQYAQRIYQQAVATQIMPLGNTTQMTPAERDYLGQWLDSLPD